MQNQNNISVSSSKYPPDNNPVGIGLRSQHYQDIFNQKPTSIGWLEVHPENYFGGGAARRTILKMRENYPLSLHGVGLSLGSVNLPDPEHLRRFKELIDLLDPFIVSDHASWSVSGNAHLNDLLPLPYTSETLEIMRRNIECTQEFFGRKILIENPSTYIAFAHNDMTEQDFMNTLAERTGCGLLLDINNIYVQSHNHNLSATNYINTINPRHVGEIHLAGHIERTIGRSSLLIDTHSKPVRTQVWELYAFAAKRFGVVPTLIEWDQDIPALSILLGEAAKAKEILLQPLPEGVHHDAA